MTTHIAPTNKAPAVHRSPQCGAACTNFVKENAPLVSKLFGDIIQEELGKHREWMEQMSRLLNGPVNIQYRLLGKWEGQRLVLEGGQANAPLESVPFNLRYLTLITSELPTVAETFVEEYHKKIPTIQALLQRQQGIEITLIAK